MAKARYTVLIPSEAKNVAIAAHHYLHSGPLHTDGATVQHGTPYDMLIVYTEETPEMDSHIKQLGVFVGEVANVPTVTVAKEGKTIATWTMRNPHYQPPQPDTFGTQPMQPSAVPSAPYSGTGSPHAPSGI